ncbi:acetyltransferase (GNAT) family protein [Kribbella rubisoli]|uniref:Acetyltransferase (GNAT) family protein n=1 Tax=Kribbella rubisoli TaxID=3075929 RepID=A0A4Q7VYB9_9ACTN|nr:acetyltransferase (GNAT) family protein [Kribbella rubisoli]
MTHEPPAVRAATAADRAGIQRLLRELHGEGADSTTLPEVRQQARTFVATACPTASLSSTASAGPSASLSAGASPSPSPSVSLSAGPSPTAGPGAGASAGDEIVGVLMVTFVDYGREPYGVVEELVVDPASRGLGTGAALLAECKSWLGGLGAEVVFVSASDESRRVLPACRIHAMHRALALGGGWSTGIDQPGLFTFAKGRARELVRRCWAASRVEVTLWAEGS